MRNKKWIMSASVLILLIIASTSMGNLTITNRYVRSDSSVLEIDGDSGWINAVNITLSGDVDAGNDVNVAGALDVTGDIDSSSDINAGNNLNCVNDLDVTDDADVGGDLDVVGSCTANNFIGDGSGLTNLPGGTGGGTPAQTTMYNSENNSWTPTWQNLKLAIDDLETNATNNGGTIWLPPSNISVDTSSIEIPDNIHLVGAGVEATVLFVADDDGTLRTGVFLVQDENNWSIQRLTIDGNQNGNVNRGLIDLYNVHHMTLRDINFLNPSRNAIWVQWQGIHGSTIDNIRTWNVESNSYQPLSIQYAKDCAFSNIYSYETDGWIIDVHAEDCTFTNIIAEDASYGIKMPSTASYKCTWSNVVINGRSDHNGILVQGGKYIIFDGLILDGFTNFVEISTLVATPAGTPHHITINDFQFINSTSTTEAVEIYDADVTVHNITFSNGELLNFPDGRGIFIRDAKDVTLDNVRIQGVHDTDADDEAIEIRDSDNITITNCEIKGKYVGIYCNGIQDSIISNNIIQRNVDEGIGIYSTVSETFIISNNIITNNGDYGINIDIAGHDWYSVTGNILCNNANGNIDSSDGANAVVANNVGTIT